MSESSRPSPAPATGTATADPGTVTCVVDGPVARLTLVRPRKHNALNDAMWVELTDHVRRLSQDDEVRVIVLQGHGSSFSSGADLADLVGAAGDEDSARAFCLRVAEALHALATSPKFTIAAMKHHTRGGGAEAALACDLRVAQDDIRFQIPVARLGVVPDRFTAQRLLHLGGPGVARRVLLLTEEFDGQGCLDAGLVDRLVPAGSLDEAVEAAAQEVCANAESAVVATKRILLEQEGLSRPPEEMIAEFVDSLLSPAVLERGARALQPRK